MELPILVTKLNDTTQLKIGNQHFIWDQGWMKFPKKALQLEQIKKIKTDLTISSGKYIFGTNRLEPPHYNFWESDSFLYIPRNYGYSNTFGLPVYSFRDFQEKTKKSEFNDVVIEGELREDQKEHVDKCLQALLEKKTSILSVGTGEGKTVMFFHIWYQLCKKMNQKMKVLFVTHLTGILNQTSERVVQFFGNQLKVGNLCTTVARKKKIIENIEEYDIIFATLQDVTGKSKERKIKKQVDDDEVDIRTITSLSDFEQIKKDKKNVTCLDIENYTYADSKYERNFFSKFDFLIVDETHHLGANHYLEIFSKANTEYKFAMSATLERSGGDQVFIYHWIGEPDVEKEKKYIGSIEYIKFEQIQTKFDTIKNQDDQINMTAMDNQLADSDERNLEVVNILLDLDDSIPKGGNILVYSKRADVKHLKKLSGLLQSKYIEKHKDDYEIGIKSLFVIMAGKLNDENYKDYRFILTTFPKFSEGIDSSTISCVVFTMNPNTATFSCIKQCFGRVGRVNSICRKGYFVHLVDNHFIFRKQFKKLLGFYKDLNQKEIESGGKNLFQFGNQFDMKLKNEILGVENKKEKEESFKKKPKFDNCC